MTKAAVKLTVLIAAAIAVSCSHLRPVENSQPRHEHQVRLVDPKPPVGVVPGKSGLNELIGAATNALKEAPLSVENAEVVAWSAKLDHLECPPRLREDVVVLLTTLSPDRRRTWALAYLSRMPGWGRDSWAVPDYAPLTQPPPPVATIELFGSPPSDDGIAKFIHASNFGYNDFYADTVVVDVVLYRHSPSIRKVLEDGVPDAEKARRYQAHVRTLPY